MTIRRKVQTKLNEFKELIERYTKMEDENTRLKKQIMELQHHLQRSQLMLRESKRNEVALKQRTALLESELKRVNRKVQDLF